MDIRRYAELMKELELTGLEITEDNKVIRMERSYPPVQVIPVSAAQAPAVTGKDAASDYTSVFSPIVGVFYAAPTENGEPYVSIGSQIQKGQTLCIIEAMKLMNEISAETDGIIAEICVTNGQTVEYGTELFRIKRE